MSKKLFIGSLDWATTESELLDLFSKYGEVEQAIIIKDELKRSKGFGFVTMVNEAEAMNASEDVSNGGLNNAQVGKRTIVVTEARPQEDRPRRDFGGDRPRRDFGGDRGDRKPRY